MQSKIRGDVVSRGTRASAKYVSLVLLASSVVCATASGSHADDAAALQRLEAKIQPLEVRHETEIKTLQAEIRRLRKEKPVAVAATQPAAAQPAVTRTAAEQKKPSTLLPPGLPAPAIPAKVLMTYDHNKQNNKTDTTDDNTVELFGRLQVD